MNNDADADSDDDDDNENDDDNASSRAWRDMATSGGGEANGTMTCANCC